MGALEYILLDEDSVSNELGASYSSSSSSSSSSKTQFFPSLSFLQLINCPYLKGWWRNSDDDDDDDNEPRHLLLPSFPTSLSELEIRGCPNLTSMPLIPDLTRSHISNCPLLRRKQEKTIYSESESESESVYVLPKDEFILQQQLQDLDYFTEPSDVEPSDAEPTEAKNKLGYKIRTLFKNCNCATGQELSVSIRTLGNITHVLFCNHWKAEGAICIMDGYSVWRF